jgi:hypothetical protein
LLLLSSPPAGMCQQGRRTRLAMDFSTGWACVSHASDVLGMCVMITSALLCTETERWREEQRLSSSGVFIGRFFGMTVTSRYPPLSPVVSRRLSLPPTTSRCLPLPLAASGCLLWPSTISRCLHCSLFSPAASHYHGRRVDLPLWRGAYTATARRAGARSRRGAGARSL